MEDLDYWHWCEDLSIIEAALLAVGIDPSSDIGSNCMNWDLSERPKGFEAAKTAIFNAFCRNIIEGVVVPERDTGINGSSFALSGTVSLHSKVNVESLCKWLANKRIKPEFFFPNTTDATDFLDKKHPHYSSKLAAAISAWQAVSNGATYKNNGKTTKQNLINWLTSHAAGFSLIKENGEININAIENQVSIVANWDTSGGAPKTPV
jgi:hypothetical protein